MLPMPLKVIRLRSAALSVVLSISGALASASDLPWERGPWRPFDEPGYGAGFGGPGAGSPEGDRVNPWSGSPRPPSTQGPAWGGSPSYTDGGGAGYDANGVGDYYGWRPEDPFGAERAPGGAYGDPRRDQAPWGPDWRGDSSYGWESRQDTPGSRRGSEGPARGPGLAPSPLDHAFRHSSGASYPGYRFRGDPPSGRGGWSGTPDGMGYRFRPLTDQERSRLDWGPGPWPDETPGGWTRPPRGGGLLEQEAYGFEPNPWRGR